MITSVCAENVSEEDVSRSTRSSSWAESSIHALGNIAHEVELVRETSCAQVNGDLEIRALGAGA